MKEVKTPKKPLAIYYAIVLLVLLILNFVIMPWASERQIKEVDYGTFMSMTEEKNKPHNLKFIYQEKEYNSFKELEEKLSGIIYANNTEKVVNLKIEWKWDYESGSTIEEITNNDILDTKDAQTIQDYKFVINVSGEQI